MATRLALVKPEVTYPVKKQGYAGDVGIPLGLLYLGGYVRDRNGTDVRILDYRLTKALGVVRNLETDLTDADVVGVGACTAEAPDALEIMRTAKAMGKVTVMGGLYPTFNVEPVLRTGVVDYIIFGEGEEGLSKALKVIEGSLSKSELRGVAFRDENRIVQTPKKDLIANLDALPAPAYDLVPVKTYASMSPAGIYAARGCPMSCDFCTINEMWEHRYRKRSIDNILAELEMLKGFGFKRVHFKDETITLDAKWCGELFRAIEGARLGMSYKAKSRIDGVKPDLIRQMATAGVDTIHTGVESVSQQMLDSMEKGIKAHTVRKTFDTIRAQGCNVNPVYMIGYPGETRQTLAENAAFITEMGSEPGVITYISFITPHPGSGFEKHIEGELRVLSTDFNRYTHKQPVAVPISLGNGGVRLMADTYHRVVETIGMGELNPRIDATYLDEIEQREERGEGEILNNKGERHARQGRAAQLTINRR